MKKKIVYLSYSFMGYEEEVIRLLENVLGFEVYFIDALKYEYKYKNIFEKILNNLYYKPFYKKNLKNIMFNKNILKKIEEIGEVECYFSIRADKFSHEIFEHIRNKNKPMFLHHWDSFSFIDKQLEFLKYFDHISSFDQKESKKYGMKFVPNFYLKDNIVKNEVYEYEFFTIMKYDKRFNLLEALGKVLKENGIKYKFIVISDRDIQSDYIDVQKKYIPLNKTYELLSKSKGIVEIGHTEDMDERYQGGASFRIADAIGNKQKIITNYLFIRDYDIYNKNNVFILDNNFKTNLKSFLKNSYEEYPKEIYERYSGENWIKTIFNGEKK